MRCAADVPSRRTRSARRVRPKSAGEEPADGATAEVEAGDSEPPRTARAIALVVLALAAICAALCVAAVAAWATATGQGDVVAGVVIAIGAAIAATAFIADARRVAALAAHPALLLAPARAIAAADIPSTAASASGATAPRR